MFFSLFFRLRLTNGLLATEQAWGDDRSNNDRKYHDGIQTVRRVGLNLGVSSGLFSQEAEVWVHNQVGEIEGVVSLCCIGCNVPVKLYNRRFNTMLLGYESCCVSLADYQRRKRAQIYVMSDDSALRVITQNASLDFNAVTPAKREPSKFNPPLDSLRGMIISGNYLAEMKCNTFECRRSLAPTKRTTATIAGCNPLRLKT